MKHFQKTYGQYLEAYTTPDLPPNTKQNILPKANYTINKVIEKPKELINKTFNGLKFLTVRLTAYWSKGSGTDKWTKKKESASGVTLQKGVSVAVDPSIIPYGSKIIIPGLGERIAHDTGTDVINKVASGGKLPVIDVYFDTKEEALEWARTNPEVVNVAISK